MPVSPKLLEMINREIDGLPVDDRRWTELAVELNQLRAAAEATLAKHDFDREPSDFDRLLKSQAGDA